MDHKTAMVFSFLASKYQSWWRKRVDTADKRQAEVDAWSKALAPFSDRQVRSAFEVIRRREHGARLSPPPSPQKFVAIITQQESRPVDPFLRRYRVNKPSKSQASSDFFNEIRKCL